MPLTYLELTEAEIEAFGAQKQRRVRARRARAWKRMAREERDAAAGPPTPQDVTKRRPRYRRGYAGGSCACWKNGDASSARAVGTREWCSGLGVGASRRAPQ